MEDLLNRVDLSEQHKSKNTFNKTLAQARNLLKKCPPPSVTDKFPMVLEEEFRNNLSDNDAIVVFTICVFLLKQRPITNLFWCDNWEILYHNMELVGCS